MTTSTSSQRQVHITNSGRILFCPVLSTTALGFVTQDLQNLLNLCLIQGAQTNEQE